MTLPDLFRSIGSKLLVFLDIIGLYRLPASDADAQFSRFRLYHAEFRKLLSSNDSFLRTLVDLEESLSQSNYVDNDVIKSQVLRVTADVFRMVSSLNKIAENRYTALFEVLERLAEGLHELLERQGPVVPTEWVLSMDRLHAGWSKRGGGKMANLGELRNRLFVPTPDGFVITVAAYRAFIENAKLAAPIRAELSTLFSPSSVPSVSEAVQRLILSAEVPEPIADAILGEYDALARRRGAEPFVAVRSSAVGEDGSHSFAGQYRSILGVRRDGLVRAYLEVVAGLFSAEALHYRMLNNLNHKSPAMAVGVLPLVAPEVSGVAYTVDPNDPESDDMLIQTVLGLGISLVDGRTSPEAMVLNRNLKAKDIRRRPSAQQTAVVCDYAGVTTEVTVPESALEHPLLHDHEALMIAEHALSIERHFGMPQDIEWALDNERRLYFLQSRPLAIATGRVLRDAPRADAVLLLSGGDAACPGVGIGKVVHMDENSDFESFPAGGVLVAPRSSPRFVRIMNRTRAIVTDSGSTTGHMASVCRELKIPALLNTRTATKVLNEGEIITVDAQRSHIYKGEVWGLSAVDRAERFTGSIAPPLPFTDEGMIFRSIFELAVQLNLTDPHSPEFQAESCRSLHDVTRFVHEIVYGEMFGIGTELGDARSWSRKLDIFLPIDLYLIDLGGGLAASRKQGAVKPQEILSVPLAALLKGMTHEKIPRYGPRSIDLGGFISVMLHHAATAPENEQTFRDPCYAICSDHYLNYTARVGYHFGIVDAYCGKTPNKNYIQLHFRGGGADLIRRNRRARTIAEILTALGLSASVDRDMVNARASRKNQQETAHLLDLIGRLLQFVRQIDAAMSGEDRVALFRDAFLNEDYDLTQTGARRAGRQSKDAC